MFTRHGRKLSLSLLAVAVSAAAFAGDFTAPAEPQNSTSALSRNGFYAGLGAGVMGVRNNWDYNSAYSPDYTNLYNFTRTNSLTADAGGIGPNATAILGYAWHLPHQIFLGTEIFGNISHVEMSTDSVESSNGSTAFRQIGVTDDNSNGEVKFTMQSNYGARVLPGYQLNENLVVYGIVGWVSARGKTEADNSSSTCTLGSCTSSSASTESNQNFYGYQLGLGSMIGISEHLFLRSDIIYSDYNEKTLQEYYNYDSTGGLNQGGTETQYSVKSSLSSLEANVSLVYMFG